MNVSVKAPAKINLVLDVAGRRDDGYHLLDTVFQTVGWYDRITVENTESGSVTLSSGTLELPPEESIAYRTAVGFCEVSGFHKGVHITLENHIPVRAGLGGASADAAGVLMALNRLAGDPLTAETLCQIGARLGADVPFCLMGGTARGTQTGTVLQPLEPLDEGWFVIVKPQEGVSTPEAYRLLDTKPSLFHPSAGAFCAALSAGDFEGMAVCVGNSFENALALPACAAAKQRLLKAGAAAACMSGSGSAVFGWFADEKTAKACAAGMTDYAQVHTCRPCSGILFE